MLAAWHGRHLFVRTCSEARKVAALVEQLITHMDWHMLLSVLNHQSQNLPRKDAQKAIILKSSCRTTTAKTL